MSATATPTARRPLAPSGSTARQDLPPGPSSPSAFQTAGMLLRQREYLARNRRRYGPIFSLNVAGFHRLIVVSDPALLKQVFKEDPTVLHAGDRSPLRLVLGRNSLLGIDEGIHLEQRKLLLPPFKGQRMKAYETVIREIAVEQLEQLPVGTSFAVDRVMQTITLRAILRAVFGATGDAFDELERLLPPWTEQASMLSNFPQIHKDLGRFSPWGRFVRLRARIDEILDGLIASTKADPGLDGRPDVLASLVQATHTDGSLMTNEEIRDQLITMLAAGHETTAHQLSWAVERLSRNPEPLAKLVAEIDAGESRSYRDATIRELQRVRPVIFFAGRFTMQPYELAGYTLPRGVLIVQAAALTHFDPTLFEDPHRFMPERFVDKIPDTYAWVPFGGGVRRCIGATFAHMEMDVVLRTLLERMTIQPTTAPAERWRFRGVAMAPRDGGRVVLQRR